MSDELIKHMVVRFLSWKLPEDFQPDAGISFKPDYNEQTKHPAKYQPTGTNLFTAPQAEQMVRYMLKDTSEVFYKYGEWDTETWSKETKEQTK